MPGGVARRCRERLRSAHPQLVGLVHAINGGVAEISSGLESETLWGRPYLLEKVAGITLKVSVDAFFQTNTRMTEVLYGLAAREVMGAHGRPGADGPSSGTSTRGVGSIGLSLARNAGPTGHRGCTRRPVEDARENARLNSIENAHFLEGDVAKVLREVAEGVRELPVEVAKPDVIVVHGAPV